MWCLCRGRSGRGWVMARILRSCFRPTMLIRREHSGLGPNVPRIQTSSYGGVGGAFDDGAAVREEGRLVRFGPELQDERVVFDLAMGGEAAGDFVEVDGALALVDLHRVAAAHRNVG